MNTNRSSAKNVAGLLVSAILKRPAVSFAENACQNHRSIRLGGIKMCLTADETNPLCDECFAKLKSGRKFKMCNECREYMQHYCGYCMTHKPEEITKEGLCRECRQELNVA